MNNSLNEELLSAARNGDLTKISYLVDLGANINAAYDDGSTVLHLSASNSNLSCVSYFVDHGANINAKNSAGLTPSHYAAINGSSICLSYLIAHGADVNIMGGDCNRSVLHLAVHHAWMNCVQLLIEHGADIDLKDIEGQTVLDMAQQNAIFSTVDSKKTHYAIADYIKTVIENRALSAQINADSSQHESIIF